MSEQPALDPLEPIITGEDERAVLGFEDWLAQVRPAFEDAAASGRVFTAYEIASERQLPDPPHSCLWGRLMSLLRDEGLIRHDGWTNGTRPTVHGSGVKTWTGLALSPDQPAAA
ncbi:hypothetical protein [Streptomyces mesophilus]|uniref:hypothetical protein n=1 Tax=Streptomyces mesophilus TaxID=1775132 RepID=UPI00332CBF4E